MSDENVQEKVSGNSKCSVEAGLYRPYYRKPDACSGCMFDPLTALPSFDLFEDRLQTALTAEEAKDVRLRRIKIAVVGIFIRNLSDLENTVLRDRILQQLADRLLMVMPKNYTVARGINYHFWIMMPGMQDAEEIEVNVDKAAAIFFRSVDIDDVSFRPDCNVGVSVFDKEPADSATLIGQAIAALQRAIAAGSRKTVYFAEMAKL